MPVTRPVAVTDAARRERGERESKRKRERERERESEVTAANSGVSAKTSLNID